MIKKSASKWLSLATITILGQPPRFLKGLSLSERCKQKKQDCVLKKNILMRLKIHAQDIRQQIMVL